MRDLVILFVHVMATLGRLLGPGGIRSVVADSVLVKQQLLILNRSRQRSLNLRTWDCLVAGLCALFLRPARLIRSAIVLKPSTLLSLHQALRNRKYRLLFSSKRRGKPGPKGPSKELIDAVVQMKQRNPTWGCPRIAQQIALAFDIPIDEDVVRRILASHYRPAKDCGGPSWLTFIGHLKDSLWSLDLFRCESATLWRVISDTNRGITFSQLWSGVVARCPSAGSAVPNERFSSIGDRRTFELKSEVSARVVVFRMALLCRSVPIRHEHPALGWMNASNQLKSLVLACSPLE